MDSAVPAGLIATKLTPPTLPANLVARPRLAAMLDAAVDDPRRRLVLVSAPAGSGKSTLIASWLAGRSEAKAWLQIEPSDADPARFWSYLVAGLSQASIDLDPSIGAKAAAAAADPEPLIASLVNGVAAQDRPGILVIDDYHAVTSSTVDDGLERLIERAPANLTIVLGTRMDPAVRLSRLRVGGQLAEIRADDLRFADAEAGSLLTGGGATLDDGHVASLCHRTEGWVAGLVLASMSLASGADPDTFVESFQGDDRLVVDYLTDEFLAGLAPEDRDRMLQTAVLDRMTGPLVDAVCDTTDGGAWLRRLATSNQLVIGLDRSGTWYRYHHLLSDLLRLEAGDLTAADLPELHLRAAAWHMVHGDPHRAIEHYLEGGDPKTASVLIWDNATELLNRGQLQTVLGQVDRLGPLADEHVGSLLIRGWIAQLTGRFHEARRWLDQAMSREPDESEVGQIVALGLVHHLSQGNAGAALAVAEDSPEPREATQTSALGIARVWAGRFDEAKPFLERAGTMAAAENHTFAAVGVLIHEGVIELERGHQESARRLAAEALAYASAREFDNVSHLALAYVILARTAGGANQEDDEQAENVDRVAVALRGVELQRRSPGNVTLVYALAGAGDVLCALDHPGGPALLAEARAIVDRCPDPGVAGAALARAEARHGVGGPRPTETGLVEDLTDRELAVLRYLPTELSQRDIASELYVSLNTVKTHCRAIYRKLAVGDRKGAIQAARDLDLL